ncbi:hypothetical protein EN910_31895, partial [Mesorhizobium sp. M7A.F.Ca.CA.004.01.1.1]
MNARVSSSTASAICRRRPCRQDALPSRPPARSARPSPRSNRSAACQRAPAAASRRSRLCAAAPKRRGNRSADWAEQIEQEAEKEGRLAGKGDG